MPSGYLSSTIGFLFFATYSLVYVSCSSYQEVYLKTEEHDVSRTQIVDLARKQVGDQYKYGGKGPNNFDCSGLVAYVYAANDIFVSGPASSILAQGKEIPLKEARAGDLIFYKKKWQCLSRKHYH